MRKDKKKYRNIEQEMLADNTEVNLDKELAEHCETVNYDKVSVKKTLYSGHALQKNESKKTTTTELTPVRAKKLHKKRMMLLFKEILTKKYC